MKRTLFASIALAALACASIAVAAVHRISDTFLTAVSAFKDFAKDAFKAVAEKQATQAVIAVPLVQAKAFVARLVKRERPRTTDGWRMCPSI